MKPNSQVLSTPVHLGRILQSARKSRRISQASLSSKIGLSQSRLSTLESNAGDISVQQLLGWCAALGLEVSVGRPASPSIDDTAQEW